MTKRRGDFGNRVGTAMRTIGRSNNTPANRRASTVKIFVDRLRVIGAEAVQRDFEDRMENRPFDRIFCAYCKEEIDPDFRLGQRKRRMARRCSECKDKRITTSVKHCKYCKEPITLDEFLAGAVPRPKSQRRINRAWSSWSRHDSCHEDSLKREDAYEPSSKLAVEECRVPAMQEALDRLEVADWVKEPAARKLGLRFE